MQKSIISKYRREFMGLAICFIMLCHSTIIIDSSIVSEIYKSIKIFAKIGVDFFFALSGFGLYYSFCRDPNFIAFYRKRFLRLIPTYLLVILVWGFVFVGLFQEISFNHFLYSYSLISFFLSSDLSEWFIAAIIFLYILYPLLHRCMEKHLILFCAVVLPIYAMSLLLIVSHGAYTPVRLISEVFLVRVPTFMSGMVAAYIINKKTFLRKKETAKVAIVGSVFICALLWINFYRHPIYERWVERILFLPLLWMLFILLGLLLKHREHHGILSFLGGITLEIYLIHEKILYITDRFLSHSVGLSLLSNIMAVGITVLLSWRVSVVIQRLLNWLHRKRQQGGRHD